MIVAEEVINPRLSKMSLNEKYTNSLEIFSTRLQISYPDIKIIYYLFFTNLIDIVIYTNT